MLLPKNVNHTIEVVMPNFIFSQTGESTPGITGYFEVEVNGLLVHSKKVTLFMIKAITTHDCYTNRMEMDTLTARLSLIRSLKPLGLL